MEFIFLLLLSIAAEEDWGVLSFLHAVMLLGPGGSFTEVKKQLQWQQKSSSELQNLVAGLEGVQGQEQL